MQKKAFIVIGLGFGDEGKGLVIDYLCSKYEKSIVIRFNGGQQAGHTVTTKDGVQHSFSNFGAGTLRNIPTYWSDYCTFSPAYFLEELENLNIQPKFYLNRHCPVTTHYDVLYNRALEATRGKNRLGSVGVGFGATIDRHYSHQIKLVVEDLFHPIIWREKLQMIRDYYRIKIETETCFKFNIFNHDSEDCQFEEYILQIFTFMKNGLVSLVDEQFIFSDEKDYDTYIFEGAQGILLDKHYGRYPFITKSNTTSRNALELLNRNLKENELDVEIVYVTRAYHTRHGSGPFGPQSPAFKLTNNTSETNKDNENQGIFKVSYLNVDLLNYALDCDCNYSKKLKKNIVVTCLDQINSDDFPVYVNNELKYTSYRNLLTFFNCNFSTVKYSFNSCSDYLDNQ